MSKQPSLLNVTGIDVRLFIKEMLLNLNQDLLQYWLACSTYRYVGLSAELSDKAISRLDTLSGAQDSLV